MPVEERETLNEGDGVKDLETVPDFEIVKETVPEIVGVGGIGGVRVFVEDFVNVRGHL